MLKYLHRAAPLAAGLLVLFTNFLFLATMPASADNASPWFGSNDPGLFKFADMSSSDPNPDTKAGLGNIDCTVRSYETRPKQLVPPQSQQTLTGCVIDTAYGQADSNNPYVLFNNLPTAAKVTNAANVPTGILPVRNTLRALTASSAPAVGVNLFFIDNVLENLQFSVASTGEITAKLANPPTTALKDKSGALMPAQTDSLSFSERGSWMVVDSPGRAMIRVNLLTKEVLPFAASFPYNNGQNPGLQTAITEDGRYAVVSSATYHSFNIYDLSTCSTVPDVITAPVSCQSRDLQSFIQTQFPSYLGAFQLRFRTDTSVDLIAGYNSNLPTRSKGKYTLYAPGTNATTLQYLGMGDSFASGEGSFVYQAGTDTDTNNCHTSTVSYPYLAASDLGMNSFHTIACSGATTDHVLNTEQKGQDANNATGDPWRPGIQKQLDVAKTSKPDIITISAVGNDIGFKQKLQRCIEPDTCYSSYEDRLEIVREINGKFDTLVDMYQKLRSATGKPGVRIYVLGYPNVANPGGDCAVNVRLNSQELQFANDLTSYLNKVVKLATQKAGVQYVDVENSLDGHRLCETSSGNTAVNGLTQGNDIPFHSDEFDFLLGNESYHPNQLGQSLMKPALLQQTNNLTSAMPAATNTTPPAEDSGVALLNAPHSGRAINKTNYDDTLGNDIAYRGGLWQIAVQGFEHAIVPNALFHVVIHSDPVDLGTYTADASGNITANLIIPADVPAGFHTVDIMTTDIAGNPIDIQKVVYVAGSSDDVNANGTPDSQEACVLATTSSLDQDRDGIDDACDGDIGNTPTPQGPLYRARNGDTTKGEDPTRVYIERNVHNAYIQLLIKDVDPDGDGWAVVGSSNSAATNGTYYALNLVDPTTGTVLSTDGTFTATMLALSQSQQRAITPVVTVTQTNGCVSVRPDSLDAVAEGQARTVSTTAQPTGVTCPIQPPVTPPTPKPTPTSAPVPVTD